MGRHDLQRTRPANLQSFAVKDISMNDSCGGRWACLLLGNTSIFLHSSKLMHVQALWVPSQRRYSWLFAMHAFLQTSSLSWISIVFRDLIPDAAGTSMMVYATEDWLMSFKLFLLLPDALTSWPFGWTGKVHHSYDQEDWCASAVHCEHVLDEWEARPTNLPLPSAEIQLAPFFKLQFLYRAILSSDIGRSLFDYDQIRYSLSS